MLIDTHCHLDHSSLVDKLALIQEATKVGVGCILVPSVDAHNFWAVQDLARQSSAVVFALGIHPLYVEHTSADDLQFLEQQIRHNLTNPQFVGLGEIGLDFFVPQLCTPSLRQRQIEIFSAQLKLAVKYDLPVILHVRKSQDQVLKYLRIHGVKQGIAHAFNGSFQQAQAFIEQGLALGFGGAFTYPMANQLRRLASALPLESIVLETDAPDMAPAWLENRKSLNTPMQVRSIAESLAQLRGQDLDLIARSTTQTALNQLSRLCKWLDVML